MSTFQAQPALPKSQPKRHRSRRAGHGEDEFPGTIREIDEDRQILLLYEEHVALWDSLVAEKNANPDMTVEVALDAHAPPKGTLPPRDDPTDAYIRILFSAECQYDIVLTNPARPPKNEKEKKAVGDRARWEVAMLKQGLVVEIEQGIEEEKDDKDRLVYTKIIAPFERLCREAQFLKLKLPLQSGAFISATETATDESFSHLLKGLPRPIVSLFGSDPAEKESAIFRSLKIWRFKKAEDEKEWCKVVLEFWGRARSAYITYCILINTQINKSKDSFGFGDNLRKLRVKGVYTQAYCLHDGEYNNAPYRGADAKIGPDGEPISLRRWLYTNWATSFKTQPTNDIRMYFGEKIALYFDWLGFYTSWLVVATPFGIATFIYGAIEAGRSNQLTANESTVSYIFDNALTPFFAFFMCIWGTIFLEFWKRRNYFIKWNWDVLDFESDEQTRPEYYGTIVRISPITLKEELHYPARKRMSHLIISSCVVILCILIVIITVGVLIVFGVFSKEKFSGYWAAVLPAVANLITIQLLSFSYDKISRKLTDWENHKTQTQYDDALILKVYLFNFVNYYSGLLYILIFKQHFGQHLLGRPDLTDTCENRGCMTEITIQLVIIFVGKQILGQLQEVGIPYIRKQWNKVRDASERKALEDKYREHEREKASKHGKSAMPTQLDSGRAIPQHVDDAKLPAYDDSIFSEYSEMVMQFGFVTLFVSAFPLAPLFALFNNITEIRTDGYKLLAAYQRPIPFPAEDIGMWQTILTAVSFLSVLTNAILIAFQSSFMINVLSGWAASNGASLLSAQLVFVIVFEHVVFIVKVLAAYLIPDIPAFVKIAIEREDYLEKLARQEMEDHEIPDEDEDEDIGNTDVPGKEERNPEHNAEESLSKKPREGNSGAALRDLERGRNN